MIYGPFPQGMKIVADVRSYGLDYIKNMAPLALNNLLQVVNERKYYKRRKQYTIIERRVGACFFNPFSPHDASKHHFASQNNDLIS